MMSEYTAPERGDSPFDQALDQPLLNDDEIPERNETNGAAEHCWSLKDPSTWIGGGKPKAPERNEAQAKSTVKFKHEGGNYPNLGLEMETHDSSIPLTNNSCAGPVEHETDRGSPTAFPDKSHFEALRPFILRESHDLQLYEEGDVEIGSPLLAVHVNQSGFDFDGALSDIGDPVDRSSKEYSAWFIMLTAMIVWYILDTLYIMFATFSSS